MRCALLTLHLALLLFAGALLQAARADELGAGFRELKLTDPVEGGPMPAIVFYPTDSKRGDSGSTQVGPYSIAATRAAAPAPGPFALIVHSHGTGGDHLGHHDTLAALARAGFVAAAVQHPRDNYLDSSGFGTDLQLIGRPHHIVALIDGVLADAALGPLVDRRRIGMAGFSAGGYTTLLIAGAVPDFSLAAEYRRSVPDDPYRARADAADRQRGKLDLKVVADARVRAVFVMAPAVGYVFDRAGLSKVEVPVHLYRPTADEMLVHPWNAERIARMLPKPPEYQLVEGAGHFVFLAPCSAILAARAPVICRDPPGIDRAAFHARLNTEMIDFFRRSLSAR
jgi:predicted dienelactone hydrolase